MLRQHVFHLVGTYSKAAGLYNIVKAAVEPVQTVFVYVCRIAGVVYSAAPNVFILFVVVEIAAENTRLSAVFAGKYYYLSDLACGNGLAVLAEKLYLILRRYCSHRALNGSAAFKVSHQKRGFRLTVSLTKLKACFFRKLAEHLRGKHLSCCGRML